ncbi:MaoC/PaaZ C-terminal domain-containing protein [Variovorax sp. M-6]|uniref:MaoC family dehydratase n=1 Tax=Variovorax sp. M-6 TaxID=3233041 RepID=UPI003F955E88
MSELAAPAKLDAARLKAWPIPGVEQRYAEKDTLLYALGLGLGAEVVDAGKLPFLHERGLKVMPTLALMLGYPGPWMNDPATGIDFLRLVHGEQRLRLHRPLPPAGTVCSRSRVTHLVDKGADKGAVMVVERTLTLQDPAAGNPLLASMQQVLFLRGNGGFSASGSASDAALPPLPAAPQTPPTHVVDVRTPPNLALIYRLSGDMNPLHADPEVARRAGFERPLLHGLATFGIAAHAVIEACCGVEPARLHAIDARFTAPVFPGEALRIALWACGPQVQFRVSVPERGVIALDHGVARIEA